MNLLNTEYAQLAQSVDQDNTAIDVAIATAENEVVIIHGIYASFDNTVAAAELTIEEDASVVFKKVFDDTDQIEPSVGISFTKGADINVKLTASGSAGTNGNVIVLYNVANVGR